MPIDLRAWLNPQPYDGGAPADGLTREAAYFTPVPEPVTADPAYLVAEAREYEAAGYDSATLPESATWPDVTICATWALAHTERLRVVLAHRPGVKAPTAAARALATLDRLSAGRTGVHLILGKGFDGPRDGDHVDRDQRYRRGAEYAEIFTAMLTREEPFDFAGEFYSVAGGFSGPRPLQRPRPVISTPAHSDDALALAARHADVLAFQGADLATAAGYVAAGEARAPGRGYWINLNMLVGETDEAAGRHLARLREAIESLQADRSRGPRAPVDSIRERRFDDLDRAGEDWRDDALYLGLTKLSRAAPVLVGSPATIARSVLAYHELGFTIVSLGTHVTDARDAELRRETLDLIRREVAARDAAAQAGVTA